MNKGETGASVTYGSAGITINRGSGSAFNIIFKEDSIATGSRLYAGFAGEEKVLACDADLQSLKSTVDTTITNRINTLETTVNNTIAEQISDLEETVNTTITT